MDSLNQNDDNACGINHQGGRINVPILDEDMKAFLDKMNN